MNSSCCQNHLRLISWAEELGPVRRGLFFEFVQEMVASQKGPSLFTGVAVKYFELSYSDPQPGKE